MGLAVAVSKIFDLIILILTISVLLTWIPNINWYNEPFKSLRAFSDIFFMPFRKYIPPFAGLDLSPIVAIFALVVLENLVFILMRAIGL